MNKISKIQTIALISPVLLAVLFCFISKASAEKKNFDFRLISNS